MDPEIEIVAATPAVCTENDLARFRELVIQAGEVGGATLLRNIANSRTLVLLRHDGVIRGVAALKRPQASYRGKIIRLTEFDLPGGNYPYELGYVFIEQQLQGCGLSHRLIGAALAQGEEMAIFATVRTDNRAMRATLHRAGFEASGKSYLGRRNRMIGLLVRPALMIDRRADQNPPRSPADET